MIDVATLSVIRRWALHEQMSIRKISRRTGLARNTIEKNLWAGDEERAPHPPNLKRRRRSTCLHRELLCSQSGWVSIRWKSRVKDQCNSTDPSSGVIVFEIYALLMRRRCPAPVIPSAWVALNV